MQTPALEHCSRYFDNAATTPVDPRVVQEMLPYFSEAFGNANSIHEPGRRARAAVELARERIAELLSEPDPTKIYFTAGATEANNWILQSGKPAACSPFEHSSVLETVKAMGGNILPTEGWKVNAPEDVENVVAVMSVNNETGAILDTDDIHRFEVHRDLRGAICTLRDLTQNLGKVPLPESWYDFGTFSAHKFYGPKGVGGLWLRRYAEWPPLLHGGEHENGLRAGTLNVPGIVGMGVAAAIAMQEADDNRRHVESLRALVLGEVEKTSDVQLNSPANSSPYIVSLSFLGVEGETLVVELDRAGYSISSGAACSSRSTEPSHVLTALGLPEEWIRGTVRISFGKVNTKEAAENLAKELRKAVEKLRTMK